MKYIYTALSIMLLSSSLYAKNDENKQKIIVQSINNGVEPRQESENESLNYSISSAYSCSSYAGPNGAVSTCAGNDIRIIDTSKIIKSRGTNKLNNIDSVFSENNKKTTYKIYLKNSKNILKMETITYYFTEKKENNILFKSFKQFSKDIGLKNGSVYIPMTNDASSIFKTHNFRQDVIYSYSKYSQCDFSLISKESLLFEIRNSHMKPKDRCIIFPINENILWLTSLLNKIHNNISKLKKIKNYNDLKKESIKSILENGIDYTINDEIIEKNKTIIKKLIQWLSTVFSNQAQ